VKIDVGIAAFTGQEASVSFRFARVGRDPHEHSVVVANAVDADRETLARSRPDPRIGGDRPLRLAPGMLRTDPSNSCRMAKLLRFEITAVSVPDCEIQLIGLGFGDTPARAARPLG
jgi:hypothetical protein